MPRGVDGLHGFDQGEYSVQVAERAVRLGVADFDSGEVGNAPDLFQGERHGYDEPEGLKTEEPYKVS